MTAQPAVECDVLIVGGGPAGSTCAWQLGASGFDVQVIDQAIFPRHKVCAGWITPQVVASLALDLDEYRKGRVLQPISGFRVGICGGNSVTVSYDQPVSFGIRRCEFDEFLLRRANVPVHEGVSVRSVQRDNHGWLINQQYRSKLLIGAGGHFCPVAKWLHSQQKDATPARVVVAQEVEYRLTSRESETCRIQPDMPELYFYPDLAGYAWCFRKGDYLNLGLGRENERSLGQYRDRFVSWLVATGRLAAPPNAVFKGHAYRLDSAPRESTFADGVLLIGDAAGLASRHSGEGIRPAVESSLIASRVIAEWLEGTGTKSLQGYGAELSRRLGPSAALGQPQHSGFLRPWLAGPLLSSSWFVRRVVLDRWFLNSRQPALMPPANGAECRKAVAPADAP